MVLVGTLGSFFENKLFIRLHSSQTTPVFQPPDNMTSLRHVYHPRGSYPSGGQRDTK